MFYYTQKLSNALLLDKLDVERRLRRAAVKAVNLSHLIASLAR